MYVQEVIYPLSYTWHVSFSYLSSVWHKYLYLRNVSAENAKLKSEVNKLRTSLLFLEEKKSEVLRLRKLLAFDLLYQAKTVVAEIVSQSHGSPFISVRVNRGARAGVAAGMPVISANGVVGRIVRVGTNFADVQLLVDRNFYADVLVQRTRIRAVLRGGLQTCRLQMRQTAEMRIGDTITTSGLLGNFPKGIPVGQVTKISYEEGNVAQQVSVAPWINYQQLEEVSIILQRSPYAEQMQGQM